MSRRVGVVCVFETFMSFIYVDVFMVSAETEREREREMIRRHLCESWPLFRWTGVAALLTAACTFSLRSSFARHNIVLTCRVLFVVAT